MWRIISITFYNLGRVPKRCSLREGSNKSHREGTFAFFLGQINGKVRFQSWNPPGRVGTLREGTGEGVSCGKEHSPPHSLNALKHSKILSKSLSHQQYSVPAAGRGCRLCVLRSVRPLRPRRLGRGHGMQMTEWPTWVERDLRVRHIG